MNLIERAAEATARVNHALITLTIEVTLVPYQLIDEHLYYSLSDHVRWLSQPVYDYNDAHPFKILFSTALVDQEFWKSMEPMGKDIASNVKTMLEALR